LLIIDGRDEPITVQIAEATLAKVTVKSVDYRCQGDDKTAFTLDVPIRPDCLRPEPGVAQSLPTNQLTHGVENRLHRVRNVTYQEDQSQIRPSICAGHAPRNGHLLLSGHQNPLLRRAHDDRQSPPRRRLQPKHCSRSWSPLTLKRLWTPCAFGVSMV